jgi:acetophenone carboxylase
MGGYYGPPNPRVIIKKSDFFARIREGRDVDLDQHDILDKESLDGIYRIEASGQLAEKFAEGDLMMFGMGGGGGYGDVLEREPAAVAEDLKNEMITREVAERVYGVVLDRSSSAVDVPATMRRRAAMRKERLAKGKTFETFLAGWRRKSPPQKVIAHYGAWPDPRVPGYDKPFWGLYR